jgi:hypothetical protein
MKYRLSLVWCHGDVQLDAGFLCDVLCSRTLCIRMQASYAMCCAHWRSVYGCRLPMQCAVLTDALYTDGGFLCNVLCSRTLFIRTVQRGTIVMTSVLAMRKTIIDWHQNRWNDVEKYLENSQVYSTRPWREVHVLIATKSRPPLRPTEIISVDPREGNRQARPNRQAAPCTDTSRDEESIKSTTSTSRDSDWAEGWAIKKVRTMSSRDKRLVTPPKCPDHSWGPPSFIFNEYRELFPYGQCDRRVRLTTHLNLLARLRMSGAIPPPYSFTACTGPIYLYLYQYNLPMEYIFFHIWPLP